jgi:hypothetical protein
MAAKKAKKSAIEKPEGFIDDWAKEAIRATVKAARGTSKATRAGRQSRRHATREVLEMRKNARKVVPRAEKLARREAQQPHLEKQYPKLKGKGSQKAKSYYETKSMVNDLTIGDNPINELSKYTAETIGIKQKGFNKAYSAERKKAADKFATARKTATPKKATTNKKKGVK